MGHIGASSGTPPYSADENSELVTFADSLNNVDLVLGAHTHTQYILYRPNGRLVVENPNSGQRFIRIRLVIEFSHQQRCVQDCRFPQTMEYWHDAQS